MHHKRKKKNNNNTNQLTNNTNTLKPSQDTLARWNNTYTALYDEHCSLALSQQGIVQATNNGQEITTTTRFSPKTFNLKTQSLSLHPGTLALNEKLYELAVECQQALEQLIKNNLFCNDTLIMYLKILMLHGLFLTTVHIYDKAQAYYEDVLGKMKQYGRQLHYENDLAFQHALSFVFTNVEVQGDTDWYVKLNNNFIKQCSNTIVGLNISRNEVLENYSNMPCDNTKINPTLETNVRNAKNNFIAQLEKIKKIYTSMQQTGKLTTEFKLYFIRLYYLNVNILNITYQGPNLNKPVRLFSVKKTGDTFMFSVNCIPSHEVFINHLGCWRFLKKTIIEPAFTLIQSIQANDLGMKCHGIFNIILEEWLSEFYLIFTLFTSTMENWLTQLENSQALTEKSRETIQKNLVILSDERDGLLAYVDVIRELLIPFSHVIGEETKRMTTSIYEKIAQCDNRINLIAEDLKRLEQEKIELALITSKELISEAETNAKKIAEKKIRQYILRSKKTISYNEECTLEDNVHTPKHNALVKPPTSATLLQFEMVDEECFTLADTLQSKIISNNKFLKARSTCKIPFPSSSQEEVMRHMNGLLAEFYYLVSLCEKFALFSKHKDIITIDALQKDIHTNRTLLKQKVTTIQNGINTMLELMNTVLFKQKQYRKAAIYQRGLDYVIQENIAPESLSEDQIMAYGRNIFRQIGIYKARNKMGVSEYTKLRDFMHLMQLNFSGFGYLQNKLDSLLENPLQKYGLFSANQSELKKDELTPGIMEDLIGIILKEQYKLSDNERCGHQALIHFQQALEWYEKDKDVESSMQVQSRIDTLQNILESGGYKHALI